MTTDPYESGPSAGGLARVWTLRHVGERPPTMNQHRTLHHHQRANADRYWRGVFHLLAVEAHIPHLDACTLIVQPLHKDRRSPQDVAACAPAEKAARDGLVDAGILDDDGPAYVHGVTFLAPVICGEDGMTLTVVEVPGPPAAAA